MTQEYDSQSDEEIIASKRKRNTVFDDESDDESPNVLITNKNNLSEELDDDNSYQSSNELKVLSNKETVTSKQKRNAILDDDSEDETPDILVSNKINSADESEVDDNSKESASDLNMTLDNENQTVKKYTFDPSIYDAEESDEETTHRSSPGAMEDKIHHSEEHETIRNGSDEMLKEKTKKQNNSNRKGKKEKTSDNMREIRRESQRMVRESQIILPYHIPKQRTLAEFLSRKKSAPSIPIRTTAEQLLSLSKQIQQQEKESMEFFKSDSSDDDEDENDKDYVPDKMMSNTGADLGSTNINVILDGDDINKTKETSADENLIEEKHILKIEQSSDRESNVENSLKKSGEDESNAVTNDLKSVAEKLQNENTVDSHEDKEVDGSEEPTSSCEKPSLDESHVIIKTSFELSDHCCETSNKKLEPELGNNQQSNKKSILLMCLEGKADEIIGISNSNKSIHCFDSEIVSELHTDENEGSDIEDFTLDLTMPEESEVIVERQLNNKENLITLSEENNHSDKRCESSIDKIERDQGDVIQKNSSEKHSFSSKTKKIELLSKINIDLNEVPTLSNTFGGEINLDSPAKKSGINDLKERFFKHFVMDNKKKKSKSPVKVSVVSASVNESGQVQDINKEVICTSSKLDEQWLEDIKDTELPGTKYSKLKAFLESKVKAELKEEYKKRLQEYKVNEEELVEGEKAYYENEAILDDEDVEADFTDSEQEEEEEDEEDLVENDVELVDKKRKQSKFVEDEADEEDVDLASDNDVDDDEEGAIDEDQEDLLGYNESDGENDSDNEMISKKKKKTKKRIIRNSESEDECEVGDEPNEKWKNESFSESFSISTSGQKPISDNEEASHSFLSEGNVEKLVDKSTENVSTEDLADICSGKFPTQPVSWSQIESKDPNNLLEDFRDTNSQLVEDSQNFNLSLPEDSQIVDRSILDCGEKNVGKSGGGESKLDSEDDDDDDEDIVLNRSLKKRVKAVEYSDDENDDDETKQEAANESYETGSENSEEVVLDEIGNEEMEMEYDSEENEVVRDPKAFFEKEAELSESDWDSEDEDEKDLDKLEEEAGDEEALDEDEVNRELGKIHMQQMLVDDKRDVRILQEILLEDGELHSEGSGRMRQFRWANADSDFGDRDPTLKDSDDNESDQEEDEENWRKKRHERELFLNKKNARLKELGIEEDDEDEEEEGLLVMGRAFVNKVQAPITKPTANIATRVGAAVTINSKFMAKNMKGSFLTSSDQYLSRLAHITTKVSSDNNVNGPKNSRNFVFSIVSPKKDQEKEVVPDQTKMPKKRKAPQNASNANKKTHFSENNGNEKRKSLLEVLG